MKSILISIKPKYCELIANGTKTVEVRKTKPKLETPFKCYIYCTVKDKTKTFIFTEEVFDGENGKFAIPHVGNGKVIGDFICNMIDELPCGVNQPFWLKEKTCIEDEHYKTYLGNKNGYGWNISDLKIYDKPKELSDFTTICRNAYCQDDYGTPTWFCKDGYDSCAVKDKEKEYPYNDECMYFDCPSVGGESCEYEDFAYCLCKGRKPITRPPQSWCYVDELEEKK